MAQTIQQQRAKFALERIQKLPQVLKDKKTKDEFISYASGLPAMIHMNGLGQAMAFCKLKSKERESYAQLYNLVSDWLCIESSGTQPSKQPYHQYNDVLTGITQSDMAQYQLAQAEALVFMSWVKKFAKAFLAED